MNKHTPQRSCAVCRVKADKDDLIRIVRSPEGTAVIDTAKKLPGRGAYICPDSDCIERAKKSGSLARALGTVIQSEFWEKLSGFAENSAVNINLKLRSLLGLARKSKTLIIGSDNIERVSNGKIKLLTLTSSDCSENIKKFSQGYDNFTLCLNSQELSQATGSKGCVQIVALPVSSGFTKNILNILTKHSGKGETPFE